VPRTERGCERSFMTTKWMSDGFPWPRAKRWGPGRTQP
jgi:hypothetical protein